MYRGVFTVGVAITPDDTTALDDYAYINAEIGNGLLARCLTGLGPTGTNNGNGANGVLGGWSFNGTMIPNSGEQEPCLPGVIIQVRPGAITAGVSNLRQCRAFSPAAEGVYTCTMRNSSMMDQSIRLGVYFTGRSESLDLYISSLNHLSSLYTAAPKIDTPSSSTVIVNAGDPLELNCTTQNSPPDTFTWRKDNDPTVLQSTSITAVDHTSTRAAFRADYFIANVKTSDNGTYTCTVTNPFGSDSATITVVVISKLLMYVICDHLFKSISGHNVKKTLH